MLPYEFVVKPNHESQAGRLTTVRSDYDSHVHNRLTQAEGRVQVGGWWFDTNEGITPRSSRFRDDYSPKKLITEGYTTWRRHFSPFGTSNKILGTEKIASTIGLLDMLRLQDKISRDLSSAEQQKLLIQGSTNASMANFLHHKLGIHVYKYNHKEELQNIVRALRSNHSLSDSLQTLTKKSHLGWATGDEFASLKPLWEKNLLGYQEHFNVGSRDELALHVYQKAIDIMNQNTLLY